MNAMTSAHVEVNVALWVVSIGMDLAFTAAGATKLVVSKAPGTAGRGLGRRLQLGHSAIRGIHRDDGRSGNDPPCGAGYSVPVGADGWDSGVDRRHARGSGGTRASACRTR